MNVCGANLTELEAEVMRDETRIVSPTLKKYLGETDIAGTLSEALTADIKAVLSDETGLVGADTAEWEGGKGGLEFFSRETL